MNSQEMQRVYGDSHTLDRPFDDDAAVLPRRRSADSPPHPLDDPNVVENGRRQGWGN